MSICFVTLFRLKSHMILFMDIDYIRRGVYYTACVARVTCYITRSKCPNELRTQCLTNNHFPTIVITPRINITHIMTGYVYVAKTMDW